MEQFKIDVSECTDDEKRRILSKLQETYQIRGDSQLAEAPPWFGEWIVVDNRFEKGVHIHACDHGSSAPERPASDFLPRFQTRPHDYTGCHPDIAAALKRGEDVYCRVWDDIGSETHETFVTDYDINNELYQYRIDDDAFRNAEPIPAEPEKKAVTLELTDEQLAKIKEMIDDNA